MIGNFRNYLFSKHLERFLDQEDIWVLTCRMLVVTPNNLTYSIVFWILLTMYSHIHLSLPPSIIYVLQLRVTYAVGIATISSLFPNKSQKLSRWRNDVGEKLSEKIFKEPSCCCQLNHQVATRLKNFAIFLQHHSSPSTWCIVRETTEV